MTNPFSNQGWSDKDYARAVGTLMGEAYGGKKNPASTLEDYELIADVIANRKESAHQSYRGKSIDQLLRPAKEFSTWGKNQKAARSMATKGMAAVLGKREDKLTGVAKQKHDLAVKALDNIFGNQSRRGVTHGSTRYNNPSLGPSKWHDVPARQVGSVTAGQHRATGWEFDPAVGPAPYSQFGEYGTPREAMPAATPPDISMGRFYDEAAAPAPYSPASLDFGPDFTSPPSQARGPVENPYEFSNIDTAAEAVPGSFAGYGPGAFGALADTPVDYGQTYPDITAGLYDQPAPLSNEDFNAIFGNMPDDATGSVRGGRASAAAAPPLNAPMAGGPYSFSDLQSWAPAPNAGLTPDDVTGYGPGGAFSSRAPSPGFDFSSIVNDAFGPYAGADIPAAASQPSGAPMTAAREAPIDYGRTYPEISEGLYGGPAVTASTSPFSPSALGPATGFGNYGNYDARNNPVGYSAMEFSQAPNVPAPSPQIIGYEPGKTITRDVPNPAWSDWSREYGTKNALQDAWLAADEDKFGWDRAPQLSRPMSPPPPPEPPRTISQASAVRGSPIYGPNVPAVNAQPVSAPMQAQPSLWSGLQTQQAQNFSSLLGSIGGYGLQGVPGTFSTGFDLAALGGGYGGYGNFGGGYDPGGYGGGYGGTAPGDAGYGSDARSGSGNMGAGNLYS
jgi:hypothetical protein